MSTEVYIPISSAIPITFAVVSALAAVSFAWARRWVVSGAPVLTFCILLGASKGCRILPFLPLWTILPTLHAVYAVAATSWLLYALLAGSCYPAILLACLFQFDFVASIVRRRLRLMLKQLHFVKEKVAFFNIPALEIDTDVEGLMVVRGLSFSLSTLTIVAHGVELGIKLSDDMELAIQTEQVTIALFRRIDIGDVYCNLKGGQHEMTFHTLEEKTQRIRQDALIDQGTALLKTAAINDSLSQAEYKTKMADQRKTTGKMEDSSAQAGLKSMTKLSPDDRKAYNQYKETMEWIRDTSSIYECEEEIRRSVRELDSTKRKVDDGDEKEMRATICSQLHYKASVPHPPSRSIRVTTLQNLAPLYIRRFLHRLPMLLRLLLLPLSYFHPVYTASITATSSGKWIKDVLEQKIFKYYAQKDSELGHLETKISTWLADANFAMEITDVTGLAHVSLSTHFDIFCSLRSSDVVAFRTLPEQKSLTQVVRLGGADASFTVPSYLLPHHEHILPPVPTSQDKELLTQDISDADSQPKKIQAEQKLKEAEGDIANVNMSLHASLPACFDQELLDFIAALIKAMKIVELEKEPSAMDEELSGFKDFARNLNRATKESMKKAVVGGIVNDQWIAKLVGKFAKKLETGQGDFGYSGNVPVQLGVYRPEKALPSKLLG